MLPGPSFCVSGPFYPARSCAARGYVIGRGVLVVSINLHFFLEPIFYLLISVTYEHLIPDTPPGMFKCDETC